MKWTPKIGKGVFVAGGDQHQIKRPRLGGGAHEVALAHEPVIDPGKTGRSPAHALSAEDCFWRYIVLGDFAHQGLPTSYQTIGHRDDVLCVRQMPEMRDKPHYQRHL